MHLLRGGPLEIPGGEGGWQFPPPPPKKKKFLQNGEFFQKKIRASSAPSQKNSCKQGKVINQNENQSDFNLHFDRY